MKKTYDISIIIPFYNTGQFLREAINSVYLSNTYNSDKIEIVIVNDGSDEENSIECLEEIGRLESVKVITQMNKGPASARNVGVKESTGSLLLLLDSDNKISPDFISKSISILNQFQEVGVVYSNVTFISDNSEKRFITGKFDLDKLLIGNYIDTCSMIRREVWEEVNGFNERIAGCEDWDFWLKVGQTNWKFHFIDELLFEYRIRDSSHTVLVDTFYKDQIKKEIASNHSEFIYQRYKYYYRLNKRFNENPLLYFTKIIFSKYILRKEYKP
ncbi:glycosyltransferase [Echinicola sp. CAU 1574]|uniref:Glycosyltransferase n=1 Tax=Echinicola arenosa TaxID=2774144 RepID=A0ABR9ANT3_9BACT|nr:glycosyltransferase [Echinicola arenosa]MBD8490439.1 glycosyltransferase [Echinicola arenosa]